MISCITALSSAAPFPPVSVVLRSKCKTISLKYSFLLCCKDSQQFQLLLRKCTVLADKLL